LPTRRASRMLSRRTRNVARGGDHWSASHSRRPDGTHRDGSEDQSEPATQTRGPDRPCPPHPASPPRRRRGRPCRPFCFELIREPWSAPSAVSRYSIRVGISSNTQRSTSPASSSPRSVRSRGTRPMPVVVRSPANCDGPGSSALSTPNVRQGPGPEKTIARPAAIRLTAGLTAERAIRRAPPCHRYAAAWGARA
jgi:hypothetical protein